MRVYLTLTLLFGFAVGLGCEKKEATGEPALSEQTEKPTFGSLKSRTDIGLHGTIRIAEQPLRVNTFVSHEPHGDLETNCLKAYDDAKKKGEKDPSLCYDKKPRKSVSTLRIETYTAKGFEQAREQMAQKNEGAHFMLRSSGSLYQILDIAYAARRDGKLRPNEIRVLSAFPDKEELLYGELKHYLPGLTLIRKRHSDDQNPESKAAK